MDKLKIIGRSNLKGFINIPGAKNAALPIMVSSILSCEDLVLNKLPNLEDIKTMKKLLKGFGVKITENNKFLILNAKNINNKITDYDLVRKMRASILVLGPLLSRFKQAKISLPGGCAIGTRPIDIHLYGLEKLGVKFSYRNGFVNGQVNNVLKGNSINLPFPSVGATENIIMASILAKGETRILNAAMEPEIVDLAISLNKMGAKIKGMGTKKVLIHGVEKLNKAKHNIISDRIVAGTYVIAAVMLNKTFLVKNINPENLLKPIKILKNMGANLEIGKNYIKIKKLDKNKKINGTKIITEPFPGFPTDLQAQFMALMSISNGISQIKEKIFENRFMHVPELNRLGAKIKVKKDIAYIKGNNKFIGAQVMASDLRASVSLVLAALCAEGETIVNRVYHLDRGYEKIEKTLGKCGPKIIRLK